MRSLLIVIFSLAQFVRAQQHTIEPLQAVKKVQIHLDTTQARPVQFPSQVMRLPPRCREGQCYAVFALDPEHGFEETIVLFNLDGKSRTIDPQVIPGLSNTSVLDLAPIPDGVAVLTHADLKEAIPHKQTLQPGPPLQAPSYSDTNRLDQYFLVLLKTDGTLREVNRLDLGFNPVRFAALAKDEYVVSGFDVRKGEAVLATMREDGGNVRLLDDLHVLPSGPRTTTGVMGLNDVVGGATDTDVKAGQEALSAVGNLGGLAATAATGGNLKAGAIATTLTNADSLAASPTDAMKNSATGIDAARTVGSTIDLFKGSQAPKQDGLKQRGAPKVGPACSGDQCRY